MILMGMVSRYNEESGIGTLVLKDGDIREFTRDEWVDKEWEPGMGQQILYISNPKGTQVRTITETEIEELNNNTLTEESFMEETEEEITKESSSTNRFATLEEAIEHYQNFGFRIARDTVEEGIRTISMRFYHQGEFGEALISVNGSKIEISETRNGEPI